MKIYGQNLDVKQNPVLKRPRSSTSVQERDPLNKSLSTQNFAANYRLGSIDS